MELDHTIFALGLTAAVAAAAGVAGCVDKTDAETASKNLSTAADNFEIPRRVVFYNTWNGEYMLSIEGNCSIYVDKKDSQLEVTCKDNGQFKKHFLGVTDGTSYFVEQIAGAGVSEYRYRVVFKPEAIVPAIEIKTSTR